MTTSKKNCISFLKRRRYGVIYADPPWAFRNWSAKGRAVMQSRITTAWISRRFHHCRSLSLRPRTAHFFCGLLIRCCRVPLS